MKQYAFVEYGGRVLSVETRCSGFTREEVGPGELAIEDIIHPALANHYVEVTPETGKAREGMLWSGGKFIESQAAPDARMAALELRADETEEAILGIMDAVVAIKEG